MIISCNKEIIPDDASNEAQIETRTISADELEFIDDVLYRFFSKDTATIHKLIDSLENGTFASVYNVYNVFDITSAELDSLVTIDTNDIVQNGEVLQSFSDAYDDFVGEGNSRVFEHDLNEQIVLRYDPCGLAATVGLVAHSTLSLLVGGAGGPVGAVWAVANVGWNVYKYARDCG